MSDNIKGTSELLEKYVGAKFVKIIVRIGIIIGLGLFVLWIIPWVQTQLDWIKARYTLTYVNWNAILQNFSLMLVMIFAMAMWGFLIWIVISSFTRFGINASQRGQVEKLLKDLISLTTIMVNETADDKKKRFELVKQELEHIQSQPSFFRRVFNWWNYPRKATTAKRK